jgi:hypothetical protein
MCTSAHAVTNETVIDCGNVFGTISVAFNTKNRQNIYIRMIDYSQFYFVDATN